MLTFSKPKYRAKVTFQQTKRRSETTNERRTMRPKDPFELINIGLTWNENESAYGCSGRKLSLKHVGCRAESGANRGMKIKKSNFENLYLSWVRARDSK